MEENLELTELTEEEDMFKEFHTPFQNECNALISRISKMFESLGFTEKYMKYYRNHEITLDELDDFIYETLLPMSEEDLHDYNMAHKMLSMSNCWFVDYEIGNRIHDVLINRIWNI